MRTGTMLRRQRRRDRVRRARRFYDEIHRGRITAKKLGKKTVILRTDADAWAASLPELKTVGREQASA